MKKLIFAVVFCALGAAVLSGQNFDNSGNGMLKGTFNFRLLQASYFDPNTGDITEATTAYGTITFDGNGNYTVTGSTVDNTVSGGAPQPLNVTGTYGIGGNGFGKIANPLDPTNSNPADTDNDVYGAYAQGIFIGSSTEGSVTNNFIAIPAGPALTNSTFTGSYWAGLIDFPTGSSASLSNALFEFTPNGQGTFGAIQVSGQAEDQSNPTINQTINGATYTFGSGGSVNVTIPAPTGITSSNALIEVGTKTMYVSADGNFVLGYTPSGYDLFFGIKAGSGIGNTQYNGIYFLSALEDYPGSGSAYGDVDGFYGSVHADGQGDEIVHERLFTPFYYTIDYETDDYTTFTSANNGSAQDINGYNYVFGDNGKAFIAIGTGGFFSLTAGVQASNFPATSSVFLNPVGIFNSASFAPITASLAPGELITMVGTGLSSSTQVMQGGQPFPPQLGGVQVMVNGTPAPIYYVSPTQIAAILPYEISNAEYATIQVINNNTPSNSVTGFTTDAMPGVFSQAENGIGYASAVHAATGQLVTQNNPAVPGEYIAVFCTGLGSVTPGISDGALGPNPPAIADVYNSDNPLGVYFDDFDNEIFQPGNVSFAGLVPGLAGLYQMNIQVPTGLETNPSDYLEVFTDYSDVVQIQVPIQVSGSSAVAPHAKSAPVARHRGPMAPRNRTSKLSLRKPARPLLP